MYVFVPSPHETTDDPQVLAVSVTEPPGQKDVGPLATIVGGVTLDTETTIVSIAPQFKLPELVFVAVTVDVVFTTGLTVGLETLGITSPSF